MKATMIKLCPIGTEIQTLIFSKEVFNQKTAKDWANKHDFKYGKVDEKENTFRLRQETPTGFKKGTFRTIELRDGVQAVIGCPYKYADGGTTEELKGKLVRLNKMDDEYAVPANTIGVIDFVDGIGQIHIKWENGSSLALVPEIDDYEIFSDWRANSETKIKRIDANTIEQIIVSDYNTTKIIWDITPEKVVEKEMYVKSDTEWHKVSLDKYADGGGVGEFPTKGELTNKDNFLLKYEKKGSDYEFYVYKPITKEVSGYNQIKHSCINKDCPQKMSYRQFVNYLFAELYLDDKKYANGGGVGNEVYIEFLNKEKGFKKDVKHFKSYEEAVKWAKGNFEKFNPDMIKFKMADGGALESKINLLHKNTKTYEDLSKIKAQVVNDVDSDSVPEIDIDIVDSLKFEGKGTKISNSKDAYLIFNNLWDKDKIGVHESMNILFLNKGNNVIGYYKHSKGGIDGTVADVEMISALAVKSLAKAVVIAHNHPSGNLTPSNADIQVSKELRDALKLFKIILLDSIIITKDNYKSLADEELFADGGSIDSERRFSKIDFDKLSNSGQFSSSYNGNGMWVITKVGGGLHLGKFNLAKEYLFILGKNDLSNPLVKWLSENSYKDGGYIEPHEEVKIDLETVYDELNLTEFDKIVYEYLKGLSDEEIYNEFTKIYDAIESEVDDIESEIDNLEEEQSDIDVEIDEAYENLSPKEAKKKEDKLQKKYKSINPKIDLLKIKKEEKEKLVTEFYNFTEEDVGRIKAIINKIDARLQTRINIYKGYDLFPEQSNIKELVVKNSIVVESIREAIEYLQTEADSGDEEAIEALTYLQDELKTLSESIGDTRLAKNNETRFYADGGGVGVGNIALNTQTGNVYVGGTKPKNILYKDEKGFFLIDGYGKFMNKKYPIKKYFTEIEILEKYMQKEFANGGGVGEYSISSVLNRVSISESAKEKLLNDFTEAGYADTSVLFGEPPQFLPLKQKIFVTAKNIQEQVVCTYLQASLIAEAMYSIKQEQGHTLGNENPTRNYVKAETPEPKVPEENSPTEPISKTSFKLNMAVLKQNISNMLQEPSLIVSGAMTTPTNYVFNIIGDKKAVSRVSGRLRTMGFRVEKTGVAGNIELFVPKDRVGEFEKSTPIVETPTPIETIVEMETPIETPIEIAKDIVTDEVESIREAIEYLQMEADSGDEEAIEALSYLQDELKNLIESSKTDKMADGGEILIGGKADYMSLGDISEMHKVSLDHILRQAQIGKKIELEHTSDYNKAIEIVKDHLYESPYYYTKLKKMEKSFDKSKFYGGGLTTEKYKNDFDYNLDSQSVSCFINCKNTGRTLILKRANSDFEGTWCLISGGMESNELPDETIKREIQEELGVKLDFSNLIYLDSNKNPQGTHHYYEVSVNEEFEPTLNQENQSYKWVNMGGFPSNTHPLLIKYLKSHIYA